MALGDPQYPVRAPGDAVPRASRGPRLGLAYKLSAAWFLVLVVPLIIVGVIGYARMPRAIHTQTRAILKAAADGAEAAVLEFLGYLKGRTLDFSTDGFIRDSLEGLSRGDPASGKIVDTLNHHLAVNKRPVIPEATETFVLNLAGRVVASSEPRSVGQDHSQREYFLKGRKAVYVSDFFRGPETGRVTWVVSAPLTGRASGALLGVLANRIDPKTLSDLTTGRRALAFGAKTQSLRLGETGETYVVNRDKLMLTESRFLDDVILTQVVDTEPVRLAIERGEQMVGDYLDYRGVPITGASKILPELGWVILGEIDFREAFIPVQHERIAMALLGAAVLAAAGLFGFVIHRAVLRPMRRLIEADERVDREGSGAGLIPEEEIPRDEWRFVMETRNRMLRRLGEQSERLQQEARSLLASWEAMREILGPLATFAGEPQILQRGLEALARAVGARYGALHVLDEHGQTVDFLHTGLDAEWERRLAGVEPPRGLGVLGAVHEGQVIRLDDITRDPRHQGFGPEGHPPMRSFLGVPIAAKGRVYGRVYLTEKAGGPFTKDDERLALTVAQGVALAVESMRLARRVRAAERLSRRTLASLFDAVVVLDRECRVRYANRVLYDWFGLEPSAVLGRPFREVLPLGEGVEEIERCVRGRVYTEPFEATYQPEGGEERTFRATVSALRLAEEEEEEEEEVLILEEITAYRRLAREQQALQLQLVQSEKLSALGQLVSGVAHELNNPLSVIMGRAELLLPALRDERTRRSLETIRSQADRMKRIIKHLLTFVRKSPPERTRVDLNALIREVVELRAHQLALDNIEVRLAGDPTLPQTLADPHQLQQVFLNLLTNAEQAMRGTAGTLSIQTERIGERLRVSVADTGPGIPPEHLTKIFDPFFTTKEVGQGTGLGLAVSHSIVTAHGGRMWAESAPGQGATFFVELPIVTEAKVERAAEPTPPLARPVAGRRILVVDDEPEVLEVLEDLLELDGHRVEAVRNGAEALVRLSRESYDLILSDIRMPGLDGPALYRRLEAERPALLRRLIFVTGDTVSLETRAFLDETGAPLVAKPFTLESLRLAIAETVVTRRDLWGGDPP